MLKKICFILLAQVAFIAQAQKTIKGVVKAAENGQAISGASVFLNNTSSGTVTNNKGEFTLSIPSGKFDLVISSIGYQTYLRNFHSNDVADFITVLLSPEVKELETVVVEPFEKDGWEKWGKFFTENFIGNSSMADECKIKNWKTIKFRHSKKRGELTAHAFEPLIIENRYLGYTVQYLLEKFSYNFKTKMITYIGYPLFIPMKGSNAREKRWEKRREELYFGSLMHFMRSVYRNQLSEDGFELRTLKKTENIEKKRVKALYTAYAKESQTSTSGNTTITINTLNSHTDSNFYYQSVLKQPDILETIGSTILSGDSIAYAVDKTTAGIFFEDYIQVLFKKKLAHPDYIKIYPKNSSAVLSQLYLINGKPVEIQSNGMYYDPLDIISLGYWSWSEKISTMLPFDYWPKQ